MSITDPNGKGYNPVSAISLENGWFHFIVTSDRQGRDAKNKYFGDGDIKPGMKIRNEFPELFDAMCAMKNITYLGKPAIQQVCVTREQGRDTVAVQAPAALQDEYIFKKILTLLRPLTYHAES